MRHMHNLGFINNGSRIIFRLFTYQLIQLFNHRNQLRNYRVEILLRPLFQSLRENRMVRIRANLCHDFNRFFKFNPFFTQKADQFRDHHRRMGVIDLDCRIVGKIMEIAAPFLAFFQNHLRACADHKILLIDPQEPSCIVAVIRVKEQGQILGNLCFIKRDPFLDQRRIHGIQIKQVQIVRTSLISGNCQLIKPCRIILSCKGYGISLFGFLRPFVSAQPKIRRLTLALVLKFLMKQAAVIPKANPIPRKVQCSQRIQKAGCQPSKSAVTKAWFRLHLFKVSHRFSMCLQASFHILIESKIDQVVAQQFSNQKFGGNIIKFTPFYIHHMFFAFFFYNPKQRCV